jgi:predicted DNA binding CopG/RHH family protein
MQYLHVYKEIVANYGEMADALKKLGFQDVSTSKHFRLVNTAHNSEVKLPARPLDAVFSKVNLAGFSYQLYMQGVIEDYDDLAKLVEKNRLTNTAQIAA